ncbi:MAG TPA: DUF1338 domain-containing protein [Planctomycetaceae bacterium]|nr:DUF1338 domain-containing protein [Planctomycetaceae bacterium]
MQNDKYELLTGILDGLMQRYCERVPDVGRVTEMMIDKGLISSIDDIENDHIAFRTLGVPNLGIKSLEKIFLHCGYERRDSYKFQTKKLDAFWYSPPSPKFPRIFISELRVLDLSEPVQEAIRRYTDSVDRDPVDAINLDDATAVDAFLHSPLWTLPTWSDYSLLQSESEYAAWVIYNRYYLNHFTISVHNLPPPMHTVKEFNQLLESTGIRLNDAGGVIKTSPDGLLIQSSTVAKKVVAEFADEGAGPQQHEIPGSYVEFAERRVLPEFADLPADQITRQHRRDGFEAGNADKIFESTFTDQTNR